MNALSQKPQTLGWEDVEDATEAFNVWSSGRETEWAQAAWEHLYEAGLTTYTTQWERARVAIRFLALGRLYRDWCCVAFDECTEDDLTDWASDMDLSPFRLGQLIGEHPDFAQRVAVEVSYRVEQDDPTEEALQWLTTQARPEVAAALMEGAGSTSALFLSLWRSVHAAPKPASITSMSPPPVQSAKPLLPAPETLSLFSDEPMETEQREEDKADDYNDEEEEPAETDAEVLNNVTPQKTQGLEWIEDGCPCLR